MADMPQGPSNGPDLQSLIRASQAQGGSGTSPLGFRTELNVGQGFSPQSCALIKADGKFQMAAPKQEKGFAKLLGDLGFRREDFCKGFADANKGAPVREASQAELFGSGSVNSGGPMTDIVAPRGGSMEI